MNKPVFFLLLSILISGTVQATPIYGISPYPAPPATGDDSQLLMERGGVITGNGGYTIRCSISGQYQSYDYLAAKAYYGSLFDVREIRDTTESLQRIHTLLAKKLPALTKSYDEFVSLLFSEDLSKHYIWQATRAPRFAGSNWIDMNVLADSPISLLCPGSDVSDILFEQAVLRAPYPNDHGKQVIFYYDPSLMGALYGTQVTYLLLHEWLWNYSDDLNVIIRANYLLHSIWIEKASSKEVLRKFKNLGIY
jgi:hypothetical protein